MNQKHPDTSAPMAAPFGSDLQRSYRITDSGGLTLRSTAAECFDRMRNAQKLIEKHGEGAAWREGIRMRT
jgi:hypothetical protein